MGASVSSAGASVSTGAASVSSGASVAVPQAASNMLKIKIIEIINQYERFIIVFLLKEYVLLRSGYMQLKDLMLLAKITVCANPFEINQL
jgi:hypothetical protein